MNDTRYRIEVTLKSNAAVQVDFDKASQEDFPKLVDAIYQLVVESQQTVFKQVDPYIDPFHREAFEKLQGDNTL